MQGTSVSVYVIRCLGTVTKWSWHCQLLILSPVIVTLPFTRDMSNGIITEICGPDEGLMQQNT